MTAKRVSNDSGLPAENTPEVPQEPNENQSEGGKVVATLTSQAMSGPLPPPALLNQYDQIVPGSAERILQMAEREQAHRIAVESSVLGEEAAQIKYGRRYAFAVVVLVLGVVVFAILKGAFVVAGVLGGTTIVGLVAAFIAGRKSGD